MNITKSIKLFTLLVGLALPLTASAVATHSILTDAERERMQLYPFTFKGADAVTMPADVLAALPKIDMLDMRREADRDTFNRIVGYYRSVALGYIDSCVAKAVGEEQKQSLVAIRSRAEAKNIDGLDGITFALDRARAMACVSGSISAAETELFENLPSKMLFAMFQIVQKDGAVGPAWKLLSDSELMMLVEDDHNNLPGVYETTDRNSSGYELSKLACELIAKQMRKKFPCEQMPLLVPGNTHLGITLFVRAILQEVYPVALPDPATPMPLVHGVRMSPLSFAWHDRLHGDVDQHAKAPRNWAGDMIYSILMRPSDLNFRAVIPAVVGDAAQMYSSVKALFNGLVDAAQKRFAAAAGTDLPLAKQEYNKVLHSIFYLLHELNALNDKKLYSNATLEQFFDAVIAESQAEIRADSGDELSLAGIDLASVSDDALRDWALDTLKTDSGITWRQTVGVRQFAFAVKRGELLTNFTVEFNDGSKLESLQESRAYALSTADDSEWLLKAAGFVRDENIAKPSATTGTTAELTSYIADLNRRLCAMLDSFKAFYVEVKQTDAAIQTAEADYTRARAAINNLYDPTITAASSAVASSGVITQANSSFSMAASVVSQGEQ